MTGHVIYEETGLFVEITRNFGVSPLWECHPSFSLHVVWRVTESSSGNDCADNVIGTQLETRMPTDIQCAANSDTQRRSVDM